jgi:hypothetical protein
MKISNFEVKLTIHINDDKVDEFIWNNLSIPKEKIFEYMINHATDFITFELS